MLSLIRLCFLTICLALLTGCGRARSEPSEAQRRPLPFIDLAASSGIDFETHGSRGAQTTILDTIGGGVAIIDYDRDGLPDLVFTGPDRVAAYRNLGGFRFQKVDLGFRQAGRWAGPAVADVDNNGWPDLYLTGYGCAALYLNHGGEFREVTRQAGLLPPGGRYPAWGTSAGFADLDGDGWVDLVVCYYVDFGPQVPQRCKTHLPDLSAVCPPKVYLPQRPRLYHSLQGKRFQDVTDAWGFHGHGNALAVAFQDADGDGRTDVALGNDELPGDLFLNRGRRFLDAGAASGTAYDRDGHVHGGMGLDWADVDGDQRPDLVLMTFTNEDKNLYRNLGGQPGSLQFQDVGVRWGLGGPLHGDVSFGARFLDYDCDGRPDLMLTSGHIQENAHAIRAETDYPQPLRLYRNTGAGFEVVGEGQWPSLVGRALATGDLDNDGGTDVVVTNLEGRPLLLRNSGPRGRWVGLELEGKSSNRMGLGAQVEVESGGQIQRCELHTAASYMSASDPRLLMGAGLRSQVDRVTIRWPDGTKTVTRGLGTDRYHTIHEAETPGGG
jgi:hypothetical protein